MVSYCEGTQVIQCGQLGYPIAVDHDCEELDPAFVCAYSGTVAGANCAYLTEPCNPDDIEMCDPDDITIYYMCQYGVWGRIRHCVDGTCVEMLDGGVECQ
jgi:hypothetical protein